MTRFMGMHTNRLDKKGRVSVPAMFRAVLAQLQTEDIILRPSHQHTCLEGWPAPTFDELSERLDAFDVFSDAQDDLSAALYAEAYPVRPDGDGRIMLPEHMIEFAGLQENIVFMGRGRIFEIWEPEGAKQRIAQSRLQAREKGLTLPPARPAAPREGSA